MKVLNMPSYIGFRIREEFMSDNYILLYIMPHRESWYSVLHELMDEFDQ